MDHRVSMMETGSKILEIKDLTLRVGEKYVVKDAFLSLDAGRITALVGESGSGKTLTALSVLKLFPQEVLCEKGEVIFKEKKLLELSHEEMRNVRGKMIAMVFQEPHAAMNPVMRAGRQITEGISAHQKTTKKYEKERLMELLDMVKLPRQAALSYPHELSGGMRQRALLAMALASHPEVLILDEATTALDVSVQKEILDLIVDIQNKTKMTILFITHDFSIVNMIAHNAYVMKEGVIVENGTKEAVLNNPQHEYTKKLIACIPRLGDARRRLPVG